MIKLKYGKIKFLVAQSWSEIDLCQWDKIRAAKSDLEILTTCTNIGADVIATFGSEFIEALRPYMEWTAFPIDCEGWPVPDEFKIDIKAQTFGQIILLRAAGNSAARIRKSIGIYFEQLDVDQIMLYDTIAISNDLYKQLEAVDKLEVKHLVVHPTDEQRKAGIGAFRQFGITNTIDSLAGGDVLKYDEVLKLDYNTVFVKLKRSKVEAEFQRKYSKIMCEKK